MIKFNTAALCVALAVFTVSSSFAQKESVILYNSQPVKVELAKTGNILAFIGLVPNYMDGFEIESNDSQETVPNTIDEPAQASSENNAGYKVVSKERIRLEYKANFAILDKAIIDKLDVVAARLKTDSSSKILLTAHTVDKEKSKLSTNRLASAVAYLGIKGISSNRIQTDIQSGDSMLDIVAINFLD